MTVAVSCNLSEGVILGVDSAITMPAPQGVYKVFENAEKLFQLSNKPIGVAAFGLAAFEARSIGSYIREFDITDPDKALANGADIGDVVESLRKFL